MMKGTVYFMKTTLIVMAAGMGSRFGGLKQMEPITPDGRVILDFSVYDAKKAGFSKVIFIIKEEMYNDFKAAVGDRIAEYIDVDYVFQKTDNLPEGRKKPWGTSHAILCCRDKVDTPFAVINADDYYGPNAFVDIQHFLETASGCNFSMVSYDLAKTLSENGTVARGVCRIENGYLKDIAELTKIKGFEYYSEQDGEWHPLDKDSKVSMNLWGFTPDIFPILEEEYHVFLNTANLEKDEYLIPLTVKKKLAGGAVTVRVIPNKDKWYGITYREDLPEVKEALSQYIKDGLYD